MKILRKTNDINKRFNHIFEIDGNTYDFLIGKEDGMNLNIEHTALDVRNCEVYKLREQLQR